VAGESKEELATAGAEAPDAFDALIEAARRPRAKLDFGGGALERRSISQQVADRIL